MTKQLVTGTGFSMFYVLSLSLLYLLLSMIMANINWAAGLLSILPFLLQWLYREYLFFINEETGLAEVN